MTKRDNTPVYRALALTIVISLSGLSSPLMADAHRFELSAEEWARPRSGDRVTRLPAVSSVVENWLQSPQSLISIHYPGGESGTLWASELRDWLVALGIPSSAIRVQPGSPSGDVLTLELSAPTDSQ